MDVGSTCGGRGDLCADEGGVARGHDDNYLGGEKREGCDCRSTVRPLLSQRLCAY